MNYFQDMILELQKYWSSKGCAILQPYDLEVGAGTFHTATFLRAIGPNPGRLPTYSPLEDRKTVDTAKILIDFSIITSFKSF